MRITNSKMTVYWGVTVTFAVLMLLSAGMYLSGAREVREGLAHLGYPSYLLAILGTAKLLGSLALLQTRMPTLREWAYAGFTINLIGATVSHMFAGDPLTIALVPAAFLVPLAVSYMLRRERHGSIAVADDVRPRSAAAA